MMRRYSRIVTAIWAVTSFVLMTSCREEEDPAGIAVFNVRDYGASGEKTQNCQVAIQRAIDVCSKAGGGMVYVPPGQYSTGQLNLKSHVRLYIEAGATIFGSRDANSWGRSRGAIVYGEKLENVTIEGRGTLDGQAEHKWLPYTQKSDSMIQYRIDALKSGNVEGMPFAKWTLPVYNMILLKDCNDVRVTGITLVNSPVWNVHFLRCERVVVDGVYVYSSLTEGVNSDGINPNCCRDVRISNCTIVTGDDCISLKSKGNDGISRPCENVTITNCRLTSASSAVKIGDEIAEPIRGVLIDNCVISDSHRGFAFMIIDGGVVSDVVISNLTIECKRYDWFWWGQGDAFYFMVGKRNANSPLGTFRDVVIKDVVAHCKGSSIIAGHQERSLEGISFENVKMYMTEDPNAYFKEAVNGIECRYVKDLKLQDFEVVWGTPASEKWRSALYCEDVRELVLDGFVGRQAGDESQVPAVVLKNVEGANIRGCRAAEGTGEFLHLSGDKTKDIHLFENDLSKAKRACVKDGNVEVTL